jgi:hypothetical protein
MVDDMLMRWTSCEKAVLGEDEGRRRKMKKAQKQDDSHGPLALSFPRKFPGVHLSVP